MNKKSVKILGFSILFFFLIFWKFNLLGVSRIEVQSNDLGCVSQDMIKQKLAKVKRNVFEIDENKIYKDLSSRYPCIKNIRAQYLFPGIMKVNIESRTPLVKVAKIEAEETPTLSNFSQREASSAALLNWSFPDLGNQPALITDSAGHIFREGEDQGLPVLFVPDDNLKVGFIFDKDTFEIISDIFVKLEKMEVTISRAKRVGNLLLVESDKKFAFSLSKDISRQLASLQLILQEAKINGRAMEIVDLRFDKPVVVYTPKK